MCQEDTEGEIKREQTQEQRTEKDSMYELSAKNDRLTLPRERAVSSARAIATLWFMCTVMSPRGLLMPIWDDVSNVAVVGSAAAFASSLLSSTSVNNSAYFINMFNTLAEREDTVLSTFGL